MIPMKCNEIFWEKYTKHRELFLTFSGKSKLNEEEKYGILYLTNSVKYSEEEPA